MKRGKKFVSLVLAFLMLVTLLPNSTAAYFSRMGLPGAASEYEYALSSLADQLNTRGIGVWSAIGEETATSPSGIDHRTRVSCEVIINGNANYVDSQDALIRFCLSNPNGLVVSFDYTLYSGSAIDEHYVSTSNTLTFAAGETVKDVAINVRELINNPSSSPPIASDPEEFWNGERIFYVFCSNIQNALFAGDRQSLLVPVPIENSSGFDFETTYQRASATYLVNLEEQLAELSTETPGRYLMEPNSSITLMADVAAGDVRTMFDTGVFSHINMPIGYFLNESEAVGQVDFRVERRFVWGLSAPCYGKPIAVDAGLKADFNLGTLAIEDVELGRGKEDNGAVQSLGFTFEYFGTEGINICFQDEDGNFIKDQVCFSDLTPPTVEKVTMPYDDFYPRDLVPITVIFSEPVYTDNISASINGTRVFPVESKGTISETVSFLYEYKWDDVDSDTGAMAVMVTDIIGAKDLAGRQQDASFNESIARKLPSLDVSNLDSLKEAFCHYADVAVAVNIEEEEEGLTPKGKVTVSLRDFMGFEHLSNWLNAHGGAEGPSSVIKARVIGRDGEAIDVLLYPEVEGGFITRLTGSFFAPLHSTDQDNHYVAEIYLDAGAAGAFELVYGLTEEYRVPPIMLIDDAADLEICYTDWPPASKVLADSKAPLSLAYRVNVGATWQSPDYFLWSSSDESIATIDSSGNISLTGRPGTVTFTLTATNGGFAEPITVASKTLTVMAAAGPFLNIPSGIMNIEIVQGNDVKVYFSSNITERNAACTSSGTVTPFTCELYDAVYEGLELKRGNLVFSQALNATVANNVASFTIESDYLVQTVQRGKCSYIFEVSAQDFATGATFSAVANICVKPLPAKAVLLAPESNYMLDSTGSFDVSFAIENVTANTESLLQVTRNDSKTPLFEANTLDAIGSMHNIAIQPVDTGRLLDVYTVTLQAKNEFDEAASYDSYHVYVYNADALKIMVGGKEATSPLVMGPARDLAGMTMSQLFGLQGNVLYREDVSINYKQYKWSNIADKIKWEVSGDGHVSLLFNDGSGYQDLSNYDSPLFLPGAGFLLQGNSSGNSSLMATHALTGMSAELDITFATLEDKLYFFRVYPSEECEVVYTNGNGEEIRRDTLWGRFAVYEESGIKSDVVFYPKSVQSEYAVVSYNDLIATQRSSNKFNKYPEHLVKLPSQQYTLTFELFDDKTGAAYTEEIAIRGGVYRNGIYCPDATINGLSGREDQTVAADAFGVYTLTFNPQEFINPGYYQPRLEPEDKIEYIIEVRFPAKGYFSKFIKVDAGAISETRNSPAGVYLRQGIRKVDPATIDNNVLILAQSVTVDGQEHPITDEFVFDSYPRQLNLNLELIIPGEYESGYQIYFKDDQGKDLGYWSTAVIKESYPFSDTVTLSSTTPLLGLFSDSMYKPGEKLRVYPCVSRPDGSRVVTLSEPVKLQGTVGLPAMNDALRRDLVDISMNIGQAVLSPYHFSFPGEQEQVKEALRFLSSYHYDIEKTSMGLCVLPTDDPLVYKGIIRFAVGDYSRENPSGVFAAGEDSQQFSFMPGVSDIKALGKGEFLKKSRETYDAALQGKSGPYKTYGGGAYMDCVIFYDMAAREWKLVVLKSDIYLGVGGGYSIKKNSAAGPIPVTAEFRAGMSVETSLKSIYDSIAGASAYITELRPYFYIYAFGGAGWDVDAAKLKVGPYGFLSHDQKYLWYDKLDEEMDGQKLSITGKTGVEFAASIGFIQYNWKYELANITKSWTYNDFGAIERALGAESGRMFFASNDSGYGLMAWQPVSATATFEDRSYLDKFTRLWYAPGLRAFSAPADHGVVELWANAYPDANPVLSDDGKMLLYLSDSGSKDIMDTALCFSMREDDGTFLEGVEVDPAEYPDGDVSVAGLYNGAVAIWTRVFSEFEPTAGAEVTSEDIFNMIAGTEIMVGVYDEASRKFITTRLTTDSTPDLAPVVATNGEKAIVAWRSVYASDIEKPLTFDGRDNIMYSVYDGSSWSEAKCLYDGSLDRVNGFKVAMLADGTSAITWQVTERDTGNTDILCAVLDADGELGKTQRLTNSDHKDESPRITTVIFPDGQERFVLGWNTEKVSEGEFAENVIQLAAVNSNGSLHTDFFREIQDTSDGSNYRTFQFVKGGERLEDLSIVWTEPYVTTLSDDGASLYTYQDIVWGRKFVVSSDGRVMESSKLKLLEVNENNTVDFFDACVDPLTQEINFSLLITEHSDVGKVSGLAIAKTGYENIMVLEEPYFSPDDILPGLETPIMFGIHNEGIEPITDLTIELGGKVHALRKSGDEDSIKPGEYRTFVVYYPVPRAIVNPNYTVTAQFGSSVSVQSGTLRLNVPDVGIYQIGATKEAARERSYRIMLSNTAYAKLEAGTHTVQVEVYGTADFEGTPLVVKTISSADDLGRLNDGLLPVDITLNESQLQGFLGDNGEIRDPGAWLYFNVVTKESGTVIEDANIANDMDFARVRSLLAKKGVPVSIASMLETKDGKTVVHVEIFNNSMKGVTNGNIKCVLKDAGGKVIQTLQTFDAADAEGSLVAIGGEESYVVEFEFSRAGATAVVTFAKATAGEDLSDDDPGDGEPGDEDPGDVEPGDEQPEDEGPGHDDDEDATPAPYHAIVDVGGSSLTFPISITDTGNATVNLGTLAAEVFAGDKSAVITMPTIPNVSSYTLAMPAIALSGPKGKGSLIFVTDVGSVCIWPDMLSGMSDLDGKTAGITISMGDKSGLMDAVKALVGGRPLMSLALSLDGIPIEWHNPKAMVTVSIPYLPTATELANIESIVGWYIGSNGRAVAVHKGYYDAATGSVICGANRFGLYGVGYNKVTFNDVSIAAGNHNAVSFIAARGITYGTGAGNFSPNANVTRADCLVLLMKSFGLNPDSKAKDNFSDAGNAYYTGYLAAAKKLGITYGVGNNMFAPAKAITRQEMFTLLCNILRVVEQLPQGDSGKTLSDFTDVKEIDAWAKGSMKLLVETGIIAGDAGKLNPKRMTTRAEVAQVLYRLLSK